LPQAPETEEIINIGKFEVKGTIQNADGSLSPIVVGYVIAEAQYSKDYGWFPIKGTEQKWFDAQGNEIGTNFVYNDRNAVLKEKVQGGFKDSSGITTSAEPLGELPTDTFESAEVLRRIRWLRPDVYNFILERDIRIVIENYSIWNRTTWVNFEVSELIDANGKTYYEFRVNENVSDYDILSWLISEIEKSSGYKAWREKNGLNEPKWTLPNPLADLTPIEKMEWAGATPGEISGEQWDQWNNNQFGPGGNAENMFY